MSSSLLLISHNFLCSFIYTFRSIAPCVVLIALLSACTSTSEELGAYIENKHLQEKQSIARVIKHIDYISAELGFKRFKVKSNKKFSPLIHDYVSRIGGTVASGNSQEYMLEIKLLKKVDSSSYGLAYRIKVQAKLVYLGAQGGPLVLFESESRQWCRPEFCDLAESKAARDALMSF